MKATASYARQNFAALLERAIAGEEIIIERHGRQVARLLPAGSVQGAALPAKGAKGAEVRGVDPRSPLSRVLRKRALEKLQIAHPRAQSCVAELIQPGARVRIAGSMARGSCGETSDVDLYI